MKSAKIIVSLVMFFVVAFFALSYADNAAYSTAPDFTLSDTEGVSFTLSSLKGKAVLISFGASWCPFCVEEVPTLMKIQKTNTAKNFQLLSINLDRNMEKAVKFKNKQKLNYPLLFDYGGKVASAYGVRGIPANFVVDEKGELFSFGPDIESANKKLNEVLKASKKIK